jgi:hypothetical protein
MNLNTKLHIANDDACGELQIFIEDTDSNAWLEVRIKKVGGAHFLDWRGVGRIFIDLEEVHP